jgi:hypothetical protein
VDGFVELLVLTLAVLQAYNSGVVEDEEECVELADAEQGCGLELFGSNLHPVLYVVDKSPAVRQPRSCASSQGGGCLTRFSDVTVLNVSLPRTCWLVLA